MTGRIFDCFLFHDELDMLECRLIELYEVVDHFILMEATTTHQGDGKPSYFRENLDRFARWAPKIRYFLADVLNAAPDPMGREQAQRDCIKTALVTAEAAPDDVVMLSDVDEIPTRDVVRALRERPPEGFVACDQRLCCFAVDWEHPGGWQGTVAARNRNIESFARMRDLRGRVPRIPNAGWHLSWLGGTKVTLSKLHSFTHPEIIGSTEGGLRENRNYLEGRHVDGTMLVPVDVDANWPVYVHERRCPATWFRQRTDWRDLWPSVDRIPGWLTEEEACQLFQIALNAPAPFCAVEIGAFMGRSSAAIAFGIRARGNGRLFSVDTWTGVEGDPFYKEKLAEAGVSDMEEAHHDNMERLGLNVCLERRQATSVEAASDFPAMMIGFVFIDGDHSYEACRTDVERWGPLIRPGGILAFHDRSAPGPAKVIAELPGWYENRGIAGELAIFRKRP